MWVGKKNVKSVLSHVGMGESRNWIEAVRRIVLETCMNEILCSLGDDTSLGVVWKFHLSCSKDDSSLVELNLGNSLAEWLDSEEHFVEDHSD
jgi:hypothetical protein